VKNVGRVMVKFAGDALYFTIGGGKFKHRGVEGSFAATAACTGLVVYIKNGGAYQLDVEDVIAQAVAHHKKRKKR
jgi:hypothetical protein